MPPTTLTTVTPLGHASVLLQVADAHYLFDPVLSDKIGVRVGPWTIGSSRLQPPVMRSHELPPIDLLFLSHAHMDHLDIPTLQQLPTNLTAVVHKGCQRFTRRFQQTHTMRWYDSLQLQQNATHPVRVTSVPSKHWGARTLFDQWRGWGGFLLEFETLASPHWSDQALSILFAGDTAQTPHYAKLYEKRGHRGVDLAIMPIGAYDPWIMNHCSPEQAWSMAIHDLNAAQVMPIHHSAFRLSREPTHEPLSRFMAQAARESQQHRVVGQQQGIAHSFESQYREAR